MELFCLLAILFCSDILYTAAESAEVVVNEGGTTCARLQVQMNAKFVEMSNTIMVLMNKITEVERRSGVIVEYRISQLRGVGPLMNDTELEKRVQLLELQMDNVEEDITTINEAVTTVNQEINDLEEDVEAQITVIEAEISVLSQDHVNQDDRLENLETETDNLSSSITQLQASNLEINLSINQLDVRVTTLESMNGTDEDVVEALSELDAEVEILNRTVGILQDSVANVEHCQSSGTD